jgi:hypothetical protein
LSSTDGTLIGRGTTIQPATRASTTVSMAATINLAKPVNDIVQEISDQVRVLLPA